MSSIGGENMIYRSDPVKVVIINTQYVETDATSFKSVVQSITGKDSVIPGIAKSSFISKKRFQRRHNAATAVVQGGGNDTKPVVLASGMLLKDLDSWLLMEFSPSMDEIFQLCAKY